MSESERKNPLNRFPGDSNLRVLKPLIKLRVIAPKEKGEIKEVLGAMANYTYERGADIDNSAKSSLPGHKIKKGVFYTTFLVRTTRKSGYLFKRFSAVVKSVIS